MQKRLFPENGSSLTGTGLLVLLPLIILLAAGIWSLRGQRLVVEEQARSTASRTAFRMAREIRRAYEASARAAHPPVPITSNSLQSDPFPFLFDLHPSPPADSRPAQQFSKALDLINAKATNEAHMVLETILRDFPDAQAASGVPLRPLILYQFFLNAPDATAKRTADQLLDAALRSSPSLLSAPLLASASSDLTRRAPQDSHPLMHWSEEWNRHEEIRQVLRRNIKELHRRPASTWIEDPELGTWCLEVIPDLENPEGLAVYAQPLEHLVNLVAEILHEIQDAGMMEYAGIAVSFAGRPLLSDEARESRSKEDVLAQAEVDPVTVTATLIHPERLYATFRKQRAWYICLVVGAACTGLTGFWITRRAYRQQLDLNHMKSDFVSSVSHELRAPIASIRLMAERLRDGKVCEASEQRAYSEWIEQESHRVSTLVENVLDFSRIERGCKACQLEKTDPEEVAVSPHLP